MRAALARNASSGSIVRQVGAAVAFAQAGILPHGGIVGVLGRARRALLR